MSDEQPKSLIEQSGNENNDKNEPDKPDNDKVKPDSTLTEEVSHAASELKPESAPEPESESVQEPVLETEPLPEFAPEPEFEELIYDYDQIPQEEDYTSDQRTELEAKYADTMKIFRSGELVGGKVVAISESEVAVDIGFKSEGSIPLEEFDDLNSLKVGDEIEVLIDRIEDNKGILVLSKKKAEFTRVWEKINNLYQTGEMVEAQIIRRIKGGMVVDLYGVEAFLPGSQIDVHPVRDFDALVNVSMDFRIIKVNNVRKNVVLSHKVLVEESMREIRTKVLAEINEGQIVEGVVKNITDFGVFVDLGGVDGLLHITDLSWGRVTHPSDIVTLDEKLKVKVLRYDKDKQRISLGLKQLKEHHWDEIEKNYSINAKVKGKVVSLVKYGAFVELEEGVEGLIHISEMSWTQHIKHPSQIVSVGDEVDIVVLSIERENRKISLGIKQCEADPWERLEDTYKRGSKHQGTVRDLVPFGAFVELEENIDGLIHISDLSWIRKVRHPGEIVKKGEGIEVVVLNFDRNERRIALGLKQLEPDPWNGFEREYPIRARKEGSVVRVLEKGVVVMLPLGVEGFIPNSQLGKSLADVNKKKIHEGDNLELEVIEFDKVNHRIVLSHFLIEKESERSSHRAYRDTTDKSKTTIGDIVRRAKKEPDKQKPQQKDDKHERDVRKTDETTIVKKLEKVETATSAEIIDRHVKKVEVVRTTESGLPIEAEIVDAEIVTAPVSVVKDTVDIREITKEVEVGDIDKKKEVAKSEVKDKTEIKTDEKPKLEPEEEKVEAKEEEKPLEKTDKKPEAKTEKPNAKKQEKSEDVKTEDKPKAKVKPKIVKKTVKKVKEEPEPDIKKSDDKDGKVEELLKVEKKKTKTKAGKKTETKATETKTVKEKKAESEDQKSKAKAKEEKNSIKDVDSENKINPESPPVSEKNSENIEKES
ncbi:MAG: 30S ribosomal protein S1 [Candidatus Hatepunaea meridiana]|nr:30S ribosomal protein S1 [Candidatus Hatepunaea meridiana]